MLRASIYTTVGVIAGVIITLVVTNVAWAPIGNAIVAFSVEAGKRVVVLAATGGLGAVLIACSLGAAETNIVTSGQIFGLAVCVIFIGLYFLFMGVPPI